MMASSSNNQSKYRYKEIHELPPLHEKCFVYGVVKFAKEIKVSEKGDQFTTIGLHNEVMYSTQDKLVVTLFSKTADKLPRCQLGDIVRLHRLQVKDYRGQSTGQMNVQKGGSWAVFDGHSDRFSPVSSSSQDPTVTELDKEWISRLRNWISRANPGDDSVVHNVRQPTSNLVDTAQSSACNTPQLFPGATSIYTPLHELQVYRRFSIKAQLLQVSVLSADPNKLAILTVWDGTKVNLNMNNPSFHDFTSKYLTYGSVLEQLPAYCCNVVVYGKHVMRALQLQVGALYSIPNVHCVNYPKVGKPELYLHESSKPLTVPLADNQERSSLVSQLKAAVEGKLDLQLNIINDERCVTELDKELELVISGVKTLQLTPTKPVPTTSSTSADHRVKRAASEKEQFASLAVQLIAVSVPKSSKHNLTILTVWDGSMDFMDLYRPSLVDYRTMFHSCELFADHCFYITMYGVHAERSKQLKLGSLCYFPRVERIECAASGKMGLYMRENNPYLAVPLRSIKSAPLEAVMLARLYQVQSEYVVDCCLNIVQDRRSSAELNADLERILGGRITISYKPCITNEQSTSCVSGGLTRSTCIASSSQIACPSVLACNTTAVIATSALNGTLLSPSTSLCPTSTLSKPIPSTSTADSSQTLTPSCLVRRGFERTPSEQTPSTSSTHEPNQSYIEPMQLTRDVTTPSSAHTPSQSNTVSALITRSSNKTCNTPSSRSRPIPPRASKRCHPIDDGENNSKDKIHYIPKSILYGVVDFQAVKRRLGVTDDYEEEESELSSLHKGC